MREISFKFCCTLKYTDYKYWQNSIPFEEVFLNKSELKTLELDTLNTDRLIWTSTVDTFDFYLLRSFPPFLDIPAGFRPKIFFW